jgi:hypothetical protein
MSGLQTLVHGQVWAINNFLSDADLNYLQTTYMASDAKMLHVNNKDMTPLMADTDMSYRVLSIPVFQPIYDSIQHHLDINLPAPESKLAMQYKRFQKDDSYALHTENSEIYGEYVYIMYLTDEHDGAIVLPSEADHISSTGFKEMQSMFAITFAPETISYLPQRNTCVIMRTGIAHAVEPCSGRRDSIAGWPGFIPQTKR